MRAFHSTWTGPFLKSQKGDFYVEDFELLTTVLSALKWQELNGDIKMITDPIGAAYYRDLGLEHLWNLGIEEKLVDIDPHLNPKVFWAAGKIYALAEEEAPCVMMDTDFIVWNKVEEELRKHSIAVIHKEELQPNVYPAKESLHMASDYEAFSRWNWEVRPCNTAFMYIGDEDFKQFYVNESKAFMRAAQGNDPLTYMVFAEQRLLAMCAEEKQIEPFALAEVGELFNENQQCFTHIWGHKRYLRSHPERRIAFCKRCMKRIKKDYPDFYPVLQQIEVLKVYDES